MKTILITGVTKGIGRAMAVHFHSLGFKVYGGYKSSEQYKEEESLAAELKKELVDIVLLPYDLADRTAIDQLVEQIKDVQLDAIVNNAGEFIASTWDKLDFDNWDRVIAVNMTAPLYLTAKLSNQLGKNAGVVNIASTDAFFAAYDDVAYAASKAGLISLTKSMAAQLAPKNIRVNAVAPGWVDTEMAENAGVNEYAHYQTPLGRNATTQEIANVVEFLLSDKSSFVTGSVITADGGYSTVDYTLKKEAGL